MKKLGIYLIFMSVMTQTVLATENKISFNEVTSMARLEFFKIHAAMNNKVLLVYFHTYRCSYCEKMKNKTFVNSKVEEKIKKNYIVLSVDYSKYKKEFKKNFKLKATPAILFFDTKGKLMDKSFYGYRDSNTFYKIIDSIVK